MNEQENPEANFFFLHANIRMKDKVKHPCLPWLIMLLI